METEAGRIQMAQIKTPTARNSKNQPLINRMLSVFAQLVGRVDNAEEAIKLGYEAGKVVYLLTTDPCEVTSELEHLVRYWEDRLASINTNR